MTITLIPIIWTITIALNIVFSFFVLFFERGTTAKRFAWLLVLFFLPAVGTVLYIMLSGHFFTRSKKMTAISHDVQSLIESLPEWKCANEIEQVAIEESPEILPALPIIKMNKRNAHSVLTGQNEIQIFTCGEDKFASLIDDIKNAKKSIHLQYFIFRPDNLGKQIISLLEEKAKTGLEVKLLLDDMGCIRTPISFFSSLKKDGGKVVFFSPIRTGALFKINFRNHRKIAVIDNDIAYTGGINVGDEYANQSKKKHIEWRDTSVRCTGTIVKFLQLSFFKDWFAASRDAFTKESLAPFFLQSTRTVTKDSHRLIQMVSSGPDDLYNDEIEDAMIALLNTASDSVFIQTPYLTPDEPFLRALKLAAAQGKDVRIMVPDKWDKWYVRNASFTYISELIEFGVKVYHFPGFIHAKTIVADTMAVTIGSTNIDTRSFALNFELNLFIYGKETAVQCRDIFLHDQSRCRQADVNWFKTQNFIKRAIWGFCRLFSPIM